MCTSEHMQAKGGAQMCLEAELPALGSGTPRTQQTQLMSKTPTLVWGEQGGSQG